MKHALAELARSLEIAKNNEPIQRSEGNIEQADLNLEKIEDFKEAIKILKRYPKGMTYFDRLIEDFNEPLPQIKCAEGQTCDSRQ